MKAGEWTAMLVAVAGVLAALAAVPATSYRSLVLVPAGVLIGLALLVAVRSHRRAEVAFTIVTPSPEQVLDGGQIVVRGTVPDLESDTLWIFEEGLLDGRRVWIFGGEALVDGNNWSFDYEPRAGQAEKARRTLSVVRADRKGERQLRSVRPDAGSRLVVYDPAPGGCEVLGQVSLYLTARPS